MNAQNTTYLFKVKKTKIALPIYAAFIGKITQM